jgi:RNA polymerase sigma-70 factor (ECF subfamily)
MKVVKRTADRSRSSLPTRQSRPPKSSRQDRHDDPEVALMLRVQADEPDAFTDLVHLLRPRIFGRLVKLLRDRQEAEDLTQEVFLRIYRGRKRYVPTAKLSTWLYHITLNVARNALRRRRRHTRLRFGTPAEGEEYNCMDLTSPADRLERGELVDLIRRAMLALMHRQRAALEMHQFQNRTYAEIALALSLTPEATKSLLYRARLQMRAYLEHLPEAH